MGFECGTEFKIGGTAMDKVTGIVLAAGQGTRMNSSIQKQYLLIDGKPVLYYSLKAFEESSVDEVVLVTGSGEKDFCKRDIVNFYGFKKVKRIVEGGKERYHSVYEGLKAVSPDCSYVLIHDGARPFVTSEMIQNAAESAKIFQACVVGMPVKDTIKITDKNQFCETTPERSRVFAIQTPQAFSYELVKKAYNMLMEHELPVTDDAMVVEHFIKVPIKVIPGSYENIKITTPEDMLIAEIFLKKNKKNVDR